MNEHQELLYSALLDKGIFDTPETEKALYLAYDYVADIAKISTTSIEADKIFDMLTEIQSETRRTAFETGLRTGLELSK